MARAGGAGCRVLARSVTAREPATGVYAVSDRGCARMRRPSTYAADVTDETGDRIRVLTLNLHCWQETDALAKLGRVASAIAEHRPQIVLLQEVGQHVDAPIVGTRKTETIRADNAALVIAETLTREHGLKYDWLWFFAHIGFGEWEEGVAMLTTLRIAEGEGWYVSGAESRHAWNARRLLVANLQAAPKRYVTCASAHFSWWADEQEPFAPQFDRAHAIIRPRHENAIFAGDFNVRDDGPGYVYMMSNGDWRDAHAEAVAPAHPGGTFPGDIAGWAGADAGRIDYVLYRSPYYRAVAAKTLFDTEATRVSDHFGLMIDFEYDEGGGSL